MPAKKSVQTKLDLPTAPAGPVECLGQTFPSEEARREHYLKLLAEKLKDPEFRQIEGFPLGEDEDILRLSDPPYYTACPNPWIADFIRHHGRPYDPAEKYHREPFAADVSEGKNHPIYNAHSYHTKVPHRAIMRYILHYTQPGDLVFDGFCGTGMTGVAAQLCGDRTEVQALGYRVDAQGAIVDESGRKQSKLGPRRIILSDLSPIAAFIAYNYNSPINVEHFQLKARLILQKVEAELGWMFETKDIDGNTASIDYTVWSEIYACPNCAGEIVFLDSAMDKESKSVKSVFPCPHCAEELKKGDMLPAIEHYFDRVLGQPMDRIRRRPVLVAFKQRGKRVERPPSEHDMEILAKIEQTPLSNKIPLMEFPYDDMWEAPRMKLKGVTHIHHLFATRTLHLVSKLWAEASNEVDQRMRNFLIFWIDQSISGFSILNRYTPTHFSHVNQYMSGVYYIPSHIAECSPRYNLENKISRLSKAFTFDGLSQNSSQSTEAMGSTKWPDACLDYIFVDPPFGDNFAYSELNFLVESWLGVRTSNVAEAIVDRAKKNKVNQKSLLDYLSLMRKCFDRAYRLLKPGRWITVEFSNTKSAVWNSIQSALAEAGFVVANVSVLDKQQRSFKSLTTTTAVKQDLVISAYKPNGGLEERFRKSGHTVDGVWDFVRTHLRNLPVVKPRGGELEFITERDPRILYDRMVAFYVGHGVPVPLSSAEFQAALAEKFPEREGMVFLAEQVTEWDKKRAQMQGVGQLSIFVEDERSAIDWLRGYLRTRPSTYQDIQPEFLQQLNASWKKFEARPELLGLLEQNFLKYDGKGEVPGSIHSYLSTQNKDLRNLPKDDARLQNRARDRWYVPDPNRAVDVERIRHKQLLREFWDLCAQAGVNKPSGNPDQVPLPLPAAAQVKKGAKKLKEVRTEAIRQGFKECFAAKDYTTILALAPHLPENVIEEDEQLQMLFDMAEMRGNG